MAMTRSIKLFAATLVVACATSSAMAQSERAPPEVQKRYDQFITSFRAALKANDPAAVASLTSFPLFWMDPRDEASFQKEVYPKLFTRKVRDCIARGKSLYQRDGKGTDTYAIFCGEQIFTFTAKPVGFRLTDVDAND